MRMNLTLRCRIGDRYIMLCGYFPFNAGAPPTAPVQTGLHCAYIHRVFSRLGVHITVDLTMHPSRPEKPRF